MKGGKEKRKGKKRGKDHIQCSASINRNVDRMTLCWRRWPATASVGPWTHVDGVRSVTWGLGPFVVLVRVAEAWGSSSSVVAGGDTAVILMAGVDVDVVVSAAATVADIANGVAARIRNSLRRVWFRVNEIGVCKDSSSCCILPCAVARHAWRHRDSRHSPTPAAATSRRRGLATASQDGHRRFRAVHIELGWAMSSSRYQDG